MASSTPPPTASALSEMENSGRRRPGSHIPTFIPGGDKQPIMDIGFFQDKEYQMQRGSTSVVWPGRPGFPPGSPPPSSPRPAGRHLPPAAGPAGQTSARLPA